MHGEGLSVPRMGQQNQEQPMMTNDDVLIAFEEFLDSGDPLVSLAAPFGRAELVGALREFAAAIEPIPLVEATLNEMGVFVRELGRVSLGRNPHGPALKKWGARQVREMSMLVFRYFRREVLKKRRKPTGRNLPGN